MGMCLTKSLDDSSQGGGDVWYPLESSYRGHGIGALGMSAYTKYSPSVLDHTQGRNFATESGTLMPVEAMRRMV